jgi:hypothetical protein
MFSSLSLGFVNKLVTFFDGKVAIKAQIYRDFSQQLRAIEHFHDF